MSRGLALLSVCCGQGAEQKEYLVNQATYLRVENMVNLYSQDLSESHVRGSARKQEGRKLLLGGKEDSEGESPTEVPLRAPGAQSC